LSCEFSSLGVEGLVDRQLLLPSRQTGFVE